MDIKGIVVSSDEQLKQGLEVRMEVFVKEQQVPEELEIDEFDSSWEACRHFLLLDGSRPVAAARYRKYDESTAKLQRIAVLAEYRGLGLGKRIIEMMEDDIRSRGIASAIILDGQTQAEAFYHKLGYSTVSEEPFLDAGIWHVRMIKTLFEE
ncbi:Predicted N-acyltransferase, GNAT family [Paenibacillus sp. UNCCL117]|uniref:GNAT family N-acetyltransferase n=1 Tax=unclassified Paenibacillus TaxID=185978 RepID=UPI000886E2BB|nr:MULTISPECIES: GNAT family N-acetyltransferase [unclassified Paenibacillus]SDD41247.1 Predicted N-acyltransferase, GNAT family [Paenibacillus sp. cl123]SFW47882.1 Predicted N-acyltransferase, GNAT family [Paenibacillus sp. UNCCL117]